MITQIYEFVSNNLVIILIIISQGIMVFFGLYLKSYFQEKGKNIATRQDINIITEKIEAVKTEFQVLTHSRTTLNSEKRNSYLIFYDKYFLWLNALLDTSHGNIDIYKSEEIKSYSRKLNDMYLDLCNARARMELWNDDEEFKTLIRTLKEETIDKFHSLLIEDLFELRTMNLKLGKYDITPPQNQELIEEIINTNSNRRKEYSDALIANHRDFVEKIDEFINRSREYLLAIN